jgi:hypothetical protein
MAADSLFWSPRSFAADTIFIDFVIFSMFLVPTMRSLTVHKKIEKFNQIERKASNCSA